MTYNIIKFDVKDLELIVDDVEEVANMFDNKVFFEEGKFWINKNGEGVIMRFRNEKDRYILEHINSYGTFSGSSQEKIARLFEKFGGKIRVERTWEDGNRDLLEVGYD